MPTPTGAATAPSTNAPRLAAAFTPARMPLSPTATAPRAAALPTAAPAPKPMRLRGSARTDWPMLAATLNPPILSAKPPLLLSMGTL